jgi:hypothetical protein
VISRDPGNGFFGTGTARRMGVGGFAAVELLFCARLVSEDWRGNRQILEGFILLYQAGDQFLAVTGVNQSSL